MKTRLCLASVAALMLTSCPEVHVPIDFGAAPAKLEADGWNGQWINPGSPEEAIQFSVDPKRPDVLVTAEKKEDKEDRMEFHLRQVSTDPKHDDLFFVLIPSEEPPETAKSASPYLLKMTDDHVIFFWAVNHDAIEAGLKSGDLKGKITRPDDKGSHCAIDAVEANYAELIKSEYWNWLEPTCISRSGVPD